MKSNYNISDLIHCFNKLKIKRGDVIYITGNLYYLGLYENQKKILPDFAKTLRKFVGINGTIAFPTHTWSLVNTNKVFSIKNTPSEMGVLTEYLRKQKGVYRQFHPFSSTSAIGRYAKYITSSTSRHVYGPNSPFDKLIKLNAKFISIGLEPNLTCSQVHQAEIMSNVPYRFTKEFNVFIKRQKKTKLEKFYLFVVYSSLINLKRDENKKIFAGFKKNIISSSLGKSKIYIYSLEKFYQHTMNLMDKDIYIWLPKIPKKKDWS